MKSYLQQIPKDIKLPAIPNFQIPQIAGLRTPPAGTGSDEAMNPQSGASIDPTILDPQPIDDSRPKSNLDLVNECDSFPYLHKDPELYLRRAAHYYHLQVEAHPGLCLGYVLPSVAAVFDGLESWTVDATERTLTLTAGTDTESRTTIVAATTAAMRALDHFTILRGWRDELYPVYGPGREVLFSLERSAASLLGIAQYGAHMTAFVKDGDNYKIWVPRRSATKQTYPGMLDNSVAGGLAAGEEPGECIVREAGEEASLDEEMVRRRVRPAGTVSYLQIRSAKAGGETGLLEPEVQYVFDLDLTGEDVTPAPSDGEAEDFRLMEVEEIRAAMREGQFKPNCALVLLDFFVRHGLLTPDNEPDYVEIVSRLQRVIEFPTR